MQKSRRTSSSGISLREHAADDPEGVQLVGVLLIEPHRRLLLLHCGPEPRVRQKELLQQMGCDQFQGFLCAPGLTPEDLGELLLNPEMVQQRIRG